MSALDFQWLAYIPAERLGGKGSRDVYGKGIEMWDVGVRKVGEGYRTKKGGGGKVKEWVNLVRFEVRRSFWWELHK